MLLPFIKSHEVFYFFVYKGTDFDYNDMKKYFIKMKKYLFERIEYFKINILKGALKNFFRSWIIVYFFTRRLKN